ncbi:MAG: PLD nuclease N-terminal domain-containing protein [Thermomicrobiales bacterium]
MSWQRSMLIAAILLFAVVYYGLAAVALRDLWRRAAVRGENKTGWALAILCLPILGAVLYGYLGAPDGFPVHRKPRNQNSHHSSISSTMTTSGRNRADDHRALSLAALRPA